MAFVALLSDQFIKDNTWIQQNVDVQLLRPTIRITQDKYILPLLGTALYNRVIAAVSGSNLTVTISGNTGTLLHDYIQPAHLWYLLAESTIPVSFKVTNKDIVRKNSDNSIPATIDEINQLKDYALNQAEFYAERMRKYLLANASALFPEYLSPGTAMDTIYPRQKVFETGMSLNRKYRQKSSLNTSGKNIPDWVSPNDEFFLQ